MAFIYEKKKKREEKGDARFLSDSDDIKTRYNYLTYRSMKIQKHRPKGLTAPEATMEPREQIIPTFI